MGPFAVCKVRAFTGAIIVAALLSGCESSEAPDDVASISPEIVRVQTAAQALEGAHVPALDPARINDAEIRKVVEDRRQCTFRYTSTGHPVLVVGLDEAGGPEIGVIKLNGNLVALEPDRASAGIGPGGLLLAAPPIRLSVRPDEPTPGSTGLPDRRVEAEMVFEVGEQLRVGYSGYLECATAPAASATGSR